MKFFRIIFYLYILLRTGYAYPCSSCGSGAADPVVLNPIEWQKLYLGLAQQHAFQDIDSRGDRRRDLGPQVKRQMELGFAQRLTPSLFASLVSGMGWNARGDRTKTGMLDTSLNLRYTPLVQSMIEPWIPQLQFMLSHRFKTTRSVQNAREENYLDSFGAGYPESFYGVDIWFGMLPVLFGGSVLRSYPWEIKTGENRLLYGEVQREILTLGAMLHSEAKFIGGIVRERRGAIEQDARSLPASERISHDLFLTLETQRPAVDNFRLSYTHKAAWGENKNSTNYQAYTFAWMRTL